MNKVLIVDASASATGDYCHLRILPRSFLNLSERLCFYFSIVEFHIIATVVTVTAVAKLHKKHKATKFYNIGQQII